MKTKRLLLILLIAALAAGALLVLSALSLKRNQNLAAYDACLEKVAYSADFMPALAELQPWEDVQFIYQRTPMVLFESESLNLFVQYGEDEYEARKESALNRDDFVTERVLDHAGDVVMLPVIEHAGYTLHAVAVHGSGWELCKYVGFIGVNDAQKRICYLLYEDVDRDFIADADEDVQFAFARWFDAEFAFPKN